jgi:hypothetical protein
VLSLCSKLIRFLHQIKLSVEENDRYNVDKGYQGEEVDCAIVDLEIEFEEQSHESVDLSAEDPCGHEEKENEEKGYHAKS